MPWHNRLDKVNHLSGQVAATVNLGERPAQSVGPRLALRQLPAVSPVQNSIPISNRYLCYRLCCLLHDTIINALDYVLQKIQTPEFGSDHNVELQARRRKM